MPKERAEVIDFADSTLVKETTGLKIRYQRVEDMIPYARNSRTHSDDQIAQIAGSIREFGFTNPVLVDAERGIIAGHGRVLAARKHSPESRPRWMATGARSTRSQPTESR